MHADTSSDNAWQASSFLFKMVNHFLPLFKKRIFK
ncbi:hypothetical protein T11_14857 [Trichinella zimbabwensis]|uniref:Uncharacterized protein n=1 Tax=Trichinella zimbabwensis TaxID=268475 RepID=A0A0V1GE82_9BILA|nr:hypothetical protein T11_14857 [Trichinella zimbabwensis]